MEKTLHLTLKKQWFDLIISGTKKEEYRDITPYWMARLIEVNYPKESKHDNKSIFQDMIFDYSNGHDWNYIIKAYYSKLKEFDYVHFYNGGSPCLMYPNFIIECKGIEIKSGNAEWGAIGDTKYLTIKVGEIIKTQNI